MTADTHAHLVASAGLSPSIKGPFAGQCSRNEKASLTDSQEANSRVYRELLSLCHTFRSPSDWEAEHAAARVCPTDRRRGGCGAVGRPRATEGDAGGRRARSRAPPE